MARSSRNLPPAYVGKTVASLMDLRLLIDAQNQRPVRWREVELHHIAHLLDESRIRGELEGLTGSVPPQQVLQPGPFPLTQFQSDRLRSTRQGAPPGSVRSSLLPRPANALTFLTQALGTEPQRADHGGKGQRTVAAVRSLARPSSPPRSSPNPLTTRRPGQSRRVTSSAMKAISRMPPSVKPPV